MRILTLSGLIAVLATSGCVHSHHAPVVYETSPVYSRERVIVTPTADRSTVRVYPEPETIVAVPGSTTTRSRAQDLAIADTIRKVFQTDPELAARARNVRIIVSNRIVTMTGTVLSEQDRNALHSAIGGMPGLTRFEDRTQVELSR